MYSSSSWQLSSFFLPSRAAVSMTSVRQRHLSRGLMTLGSDRSGSRRACPGRPSGRSARRGLIPTDATEERMGRRLLARLNKDGIIYAQSQGITRSGRRIRRNHSYERFAQWRSLAAISKRKLISRRYNVLPLWRSATADEPKRRQRAIRPKVSAGNHHV